MKHGNGITLIELMVAIAILGILATVAVPSFRETIIGNRVTTVANSVLNALSLARSEAIKRNARVAVCRRNSAGTDCSDGPQWEAGWLVFVDPDINGQIEQADQIIKSTQPIQGGITVRAGGNFQNGVSFDGTGVSHGASGLNNDSFQVCRPDGDKSRSKQVVVNGVGRAVVRNPATNCP